MDSTAEIGQNKSGTNSNESARENSKRRRPLIRRGIVGGFNNPSSSLQEAHGTPSCIIPNPQEEENRRGESSVGGNRSDCSSGQYQAQEHAGVGVIDEDYDAFEG